MILPVVWCVLLVIFGIVANMFDIYYVPTTPSLNRVGEVSEVSNTKSKSLLELKITFGNDRASTYS